jgi:CO/xanthine dehydrogenase Mo-binding subunit
MTDNPPAKEPRMNPFSIVGQDVPRTDAKAKATGRAIYADDIKLPGMLHGKLLRSPVAHARITHIDTSRAKALPGVKSVITGADIPQVRYGNWRLFPATQDETALAADTVRFIGDEVAAVAAVDAATAAEALERITVDYEPLPAAFDLDAALAPGAPVIHDAAPATSASTAKSPTGTSKRDSPSPTTSGRTPSLSNRSAMRTWSRAAASPKARATGG